VTSGFADRTRDEAKSYLALASQALDVLPVCLEKTLLGAMIDFVLTRDK
jgi:octaprenyl-diphosphate synthase